MPPDPDTDSHGSAGPAADRAAAPGPRRPPINYETILAGTAERYRDCGRFARVYVRAKLRHDPVHRDVLTLAAQERFGDVLDIGCGRGQLGIALLLAGLAASVTGVDCRAPHLAQARQAAAGLAFRAKTQDLAAEFECPPADTILAVDLLYQLDDDAQRRLLRSAAQAARRRIVLRLLDPGRGVRSALTVGLERLWRGVSPHAGRHVTPWPVPRVAAILEAAGYGVGVAPCWRGTPFANVILVAQRR